MLIWLVKFYLNAVINVANSFYSININFSLCKIKDVLFVMEKKKEVEELKIYLIYEINSIIILFYDQYQR
jgi:hypothetical protein